MLAKRALLSFRHFFRLYEDTNLLQFFQIVPLEMINSFQRDRGAVVMVATVGPSRPNRILGTGHWSMRLGEVRRQRRDGAGAGLSRQQGTPRLRALVLC